MLSKVASRTRLLAYGVNSAFILLDHVREFLLIVIHFYSYFNDLHELDATSQRKTTSCKTKLTNFRSSYIGGLKTFVQLPKKFWRRFGAPLNEKSAQLVVLQLVTLILAERGILYHSTIFCNSLIFKCRLQAFSLILHEKWRRTGARQNVLKHCV